MNKPIVNIYTDGGCWPNPGPGGWAAILMSEGCETRRITGNQEQTTNNQMELTAAIQALKALKKPCHVILNTDSQYLMRGFTVWLPNWLANGWRTAAKKPVENKDLWLELIEAAAPHDIVWYHVKGHNGNVYNEEVDRLATEAREELTERMSNDE